MPLNPRIVDWSRQVVWLVGASSGIGAATASLLHRRGAQVVVSARRRETLDDFVRQHAGAQAVVCDVNDRATVQQAAREVLAQHGRIDFAVYCAGHYSAQRATAFDLDEMLRHQQTNYVGALYMLDAVLPVLLRQGQGHVSLLASVAGYRGLPNALAYGPTKAALINLAEILYLDLSPRGLGVSIVNPGFVATPLTAQNQFHMPALITPEQAAEEIVAGWQAGRFEIHFPKRFTLVLKALGHVWDSLYFAAVRRATGL